MSFLRKKDYYSLVDEDTVDIITNSTDTFLSDREKASQEEISTYIRHRYEAGKIFKDILTFDYNTQYQIGDLIEWSETAYNISSTYNIGYRCSYSGNIYSCNANGITGAWDSSKWDLLAENESLYYCVVPAYQQLPSTSFAYSSNNYTGNHKEITGWDKKTYNTLYLKRDGDEIKIYYSSSDRSSDINKIGYFEYRQDGVSLPVTMLINHGYDDNNILGGFVDVIGYIPDGTEWTIVASNYWASGDNRNQLMVQLMIDITLYHILSRIQPRNIPDHRKERYDGNDPRQIGGAIGFLKNIRDGKGQMDLPIHSDTERGQRITFWSEDKLNYNY